MEDRSKETLDVVRAAMALAERDVDLGLASLEQIQSIPRTRFAPAERAQLHRLLKAEGKSLREAAEITGSSKDTVARDVANETKTVANETPEISEIEQSRKREAALRDQLPQRDLEVSDAEGDHTETPKPHENEPPPNPLAVAWEAASKEERASFLYGLGREVLFEALDGIAAEDKRTAMQRAADRAEARSAEPKRRGRPPGCSYGSSSGAPTLSPRRFRRPRPPWTTPEQQKPDATNIPMDTK